MINVRFKKLALFAIFGLSTTVIMAADLEEGQSMYEEDCTKCHDSSVFTRENRKVNDMAALKKQVHRCVTSQGYSWFDEDEENVTAYLSKTFYKFKK